MLGVARTAKDEGTSQAVALIGNHSGSIREIAPLRQFALRIPKRSEERYKKGNRFEAAMRKYVGSLIGVDDGNEEVFSDFASGGSMWTGQGSRERRKKITFSEPFLTPPTVQVSLSLWDMDQGANVRADILADKVTAKGFDLVFRTWSDTRVARVRMSWMAIGEVRSEDDWDVM